MKKSPKTSHTKHTFRFPRVLDVKNGTDLKSERSIRSAIKFATKALKIPYLYVSSSENYEQKTVCSISKCFIVTLYLRNVKSYRYGFFGTFVALK